MRYIVKSYINCDRCSLCNFRRNIIFGRGKIPAKLLFIGESPNKSEDLMGEPFVGPIGRLLEEGIKTAVRLAGVTEAPSYFLTTIVACRPTLVLSGPNRAPYDWEALRCSERLMKTFADVRPRRVIFLGPTAKQYGNKTFPGAVTMHHPQYILRAGGTSSPLFKAFARDLSAIFQEVSK